MNSYGVLIGSMLSQASMESSDKSEEEQEKEPNGAADNVELKSNPDYKPQGAVMIEFTQTLEDSEALQDLKMSLESKGWVVLTRLPVYSTEDTSNGDSTGRPVPQEQETIVNTIVNGINQVYDSAGDIYKVVQLVRPEDTVVGSQADIIYLMNDNGDVKDYLRNEGHLVESDTDALHLMLLTDNEKDL